MSIRTFRNKVIRTKYGLDGLRAARGPRRVRRSLFRIAKHRAAKRAEAAERARNEATAQANRPQRKRPGIIGRAMRALGFGKRVGG